MLAAGLAPDFLQEGTEPLGRKFVVAPKLALMMLVMRGMVVVMMLLLMSEQEEEQEDNYEVDGLQLARSKSDKVPS